MQRLLIRNIKTLVSCDEQDTVYENVDLYAENGIIRAIGPKLDRQADEVLDASHMLCYPGLVNTHHHLYQQFSRNLPQVQNMELFDWLKTLYEIWKNLDAEVIRLSSLTGMGELMKHGCTTCFDHHYVFPVGAGDLIGTQFEAASELGMRMHCSRGSMDLSVKDGGLPPDSVVQTVDEIMKDSERVIAQYHDRSFGAMHRVALAPCSPFSVSADLLRESAVLARQLGVRLHTHLCETKDEENFMLQREGIRPLEYMARLGWLGGDVWFAHGIHFNDEELRLLARTGTGVAHCPISNMKLASGVARIPEMLALGVPVGLAVDGSASNDGSSLLEELRVAFLLHRLHASRQAPTGYDILKTLDKGDVIELTAQEGDWYRISFDGKRGYVAAQYVTRYDTASGLNGAGRVTADVLNIRTAAKSGSTSLGTVSQGTVIAVTGIESGGWFAVTYNGISGYVASRYLLICPTSALTGTADKPAENTTTEGSPAEAPAETPTTPAASASGSSIVSIAQQYLGVPYVYGGSSASGFDCSGFTMYVFAQVGIKLPHGATSQLSYGTEVSRSDLQPGDLVFFQDYGYTASHVGIYIGGDQFIHASSSYYNGHCVVITSLSETYYNNHYLTARRH